MEKHTLRNHSHCTCFWMFVCVAVFPLFSFCQQAVRCLLGGNNGAGRAVNMKCACVFVKVCQWNGQRCAGVSTGLVIRCCADKPAIETFFHFKAPRGFSGHWLNGSGGRGGVGGNRCSPWVVQSLPPSAFFFGGWALARPLTRLKATRSPSRAPSPWHPDSD